MSACTKYIRQQTKESQITDFMMAKHLRLLLILLLGAVTSCKTTQQIPQQPTGKEAKREFRGAWIQTAFQGEYKDMTPAQMRKDFIRKLNYLQNAGSTLSSSRYARKPTPSINPTSNPGAVSIPAGRDSPGRRLRCDGLPDRRMPQTEYGIPRLAEPLSGKHSREYPFCRFTYI